MADKPTKGATKEQSKLSAQEALEELFENYYNRRREIYLMNFFRGVFFGFGSLIGGTIVVAILIWILTSFQGIPFLTGIIEAIKNAIQR